MKWNTKHYYCPRWANGRPEQSMASWKFHAVEETLKDPMCYRMYILTPGLYPHHAMENGSKKIFS